MRGESGAFAAGGTAKRGEIGPQGRRQLHSWISESLDGETKFAFGCTPPFLIVTPDLFRGPAALCLQERAGFRKKSGMTRRKTQEALQPAILANPLNQILSADG